MTYIPPDPPSAYAIPPFAGAPDLGCREADPELFFPARGEGPGTPQDARRTRPWKGTRMSRPCCATWDANPLIAETPLMHARLDGYPVTPGHALIIPKRHAESLLDLTTGELLDLRSLIAHLCWASDAADFTIGVNDGPAAGRTVHHLHVHVIPRRPGDVADPRGGIRRVLIPDVTADPWINQDRRTA